MDQVTNVEVFTRAGDSRFVYAVHADDATRVFHLEDDTAVEYRAYTKTHLRCPVGDCPRPALTTVARAEKRDGFKHLAVDVSTNHAPESMLHHQGKAAIAKWLTDTYGQHLHVTVETSLDGGERRPDVMATSRATGAQMVFEVQYSYEPPHVWQQRHQWYRDRGIVDVWLFGHTGAHLRVAGTGRVALNPTHRAVLAEGMPVLWFNPFDMTIATAVTRGSEPPPGSFGRQARVPAFDYGHLEIALLSDVLVTGEGLRTDLLDELDANRDRLAGLWAAYNAKVKPVAAAVAAAPALSDHAPEPVRGVAVVKETRKQRAARKAAEREELEERLRRSERRNERHREMRRRWVNDPVHQHLLDVYGALPPLLHVGPESDPLTLGVVQEHWRAIVIADVFLTLPVTAQVTTAMILDVLTRRGITYAEPDMVNEIRTWVCTLERHGIVRVSDGDGTFTITSTIPGPRATAREPAQEQPRCATCRQPLAQVLADQGFTTHPMDPCTPGSGRWLASLRH